MISINSKNYTLNEVVKVEINDKVYNLPLIKYLKYKTIKKLIKIKDDENDIEAVVDILSEYIPMDVLEELSINNLIEIVDAWKGVSSDGEDLGN